MKSVCVCMCYLLPSSHLVTVDPDKALSHHGIQALVEALRGHSGRCKLVGECGSQLWKQVVAEGGRQGHLKQARGGGREGSWKGEGRVEGGGKGMEEGIRGGFSCTWGAGEGR